MKKINLKLLKRCTQLEILKAVFLVRPHIEIC